MISPTGKLALAKAPPRLTSGVELTFTGSNIGAGLKRRCPL